MENLYPDPDDIYQTDLYDISDFGIDSDPEPERKKSSRFLRIVALVVLLSWLIGATGLAALFVDRQNAEDEQPAVLAVVDQYMKYMQVNNIEDAYKLLSNRQQSITSMNDLKTQLDGKNHIPFEGYRTVWVKQFNIRTRVLSNAQLLPGISAEVIADVNYQGGYIGEVSAILEKQNGEWKLSGIKIIAPPDKYKKVLRF